MKDKLIEQSKRARENAYVPYSQFKVGAALLTKTGKIITGCNIENASFSLACCAERTAIFNAVSQGDTDLVEMAVIADSKGPVSPCGACRQVMTEFFSQDAPIYLSNLNGDIQETTVQRLLPYSFSLSDRKN